MALRETAHQCPILVLPQSRLVRLGLIGPLPQFSTFLYRYVSFPFPFPYAFMVFANILSFTCTLIGLNFITAVVPCLCEFPIGALTGTAIFFRSVFSLGHSWYYYCTQHYLWTVFIVLVLL